MNNKSIIYGIIIIVVVAFLTGCGFYNLVDSKEFKEHFGALGYVVNNNEKPVVDSENSLRAIKEDVSFVIDYYEFKDELLAKKGYQKFKDSLPEYITSDGNTDEKQNVVFTKAVCVTDGEYIVISRVKNTLIFINAKKDYQKEVDKLLEDIKY